MWKLLLLLIYFLERKKYSIANKLVFHSENNATGIRYVGLFFAVAYTAFTILFPQSVFLDMLVIYTTVITTGYFVISRKDLPGRILNIICLVIILFCINKSIFPYLSIFERHFSDVAGITYYRLTLESLWGLGVIAFLQSYATRVHKNRADLLSNTSVSYLIVLIAVQMLGTIMGVRFVSRYIEDFALRLLTEILVAASCINVCFLLWLLMYFRRKKENTEETLNVSEELRKSQLSLYKSMLEREEDTRRFRHDIRMHLGCINELLTKGRYEELDSYLKSMNMEFSELDRKSYTTLNEMFDAILHDKLRRLDERVRVTVVGHFPSQEKLELYDFCQVFSNLLENAVEELERLSKKGKTGILKITIKQAGAVTEVRIKNSTDKEIILNRNGLPETEKEDKRQHGFGLKNVKHALEKYQGELEFVTGNNLFETVVRYR